MRGMLATTSHLAGGNALDRSLITVPELDEAQPSTMSHFIDPQIATLVSAPTALIPISSRPPVPTAHSERPLAMPAG